MSQGKVFTLAASFVVLFSYFPNPVRSQYINDGRYWTRTSDLEIIIRNGRLHKCYTERSAGCGSMYIKPSSENCTVWLITGPSKKLLMRQNQSSCEGV